MSLKALKWFAGLPAKNLTHGEFRVLFCLCVYHNEITNTSPTQKYLRKKANLSNGGLNKILKSLEEKGFILRQQQRDFLTNRQRPTCYTLGFDFPTIKGVLS